MRDFKHAFDGPAAKCSVTSKGGDCTPAKLRASSRDNIDKVKPSRPCTWRAQCSIVLQKSVSFVPCTNASLFLPSMPSCTSLCRTPIAFASEQCLFFRLCPPWPCGAFVAQKSPGMCAALAPAQPHSQFFFRRFQGTCAWHVLLSREANWLLLCLKRCTFVMSMYQQKALSNFSLGDFGVLASCT